MIDNRIDSMLNDQYRIGRAKWALASREDYSSPTFLLSIRYI